MSLDAQLALAAKSTAHLGCQNTACISNLQMLFVTDVLDVNDIGIELEGFLLHTVVFKFLLSLCSPME